jgi:hypothetical protein
VSFDSIEVQSYLKGVEYPASKDDLISTADENEAPDEVIERLQSMEGHQYDGPDEVAEALGDL